MVAIPQQQHTDSHYKQMWMHERNRRMEVEQENIRLRKMIYNTKFSPMERIVAIEVADQVKESKHTDEQGRKLFNQTQAADKLEIDRSTIHTAMKVLTQSGFITDKETSSLKDADGNKVRSKDGNPIYTTHLSIDQNLLEDFSKAERITPRKIKENRKKPVYACRECGTEDVTIKETKSLICKNPNCKKCGHEVFIEASYTEQKPTNKQEPNTQEETPEEDLYSVEIFNTIQLVDTSVEIFNTIPSDDESSNPPCSVSTPLDHDSIIKDWLKLRGDDFIYSTGSLKTEEKYLSKPKGYQPDLDAYLAGHLGHIYGTKLIDQQTGKTSVLCFEIDQAEQDDQAENYLLDLARAGAAAVYWQRYANERRRGHLELYFDQAVDPEVARLWALEICPDLEAVPEVFPCDGSENRTKHALSWPLYQRIGSKVTPCKAKYILPDPHTGGLQEMDPTDKEALAGLVTLAVTSASLVKEFETVLEARAELQSREQGQDNDHGGVIGRKPRPRTQAQREKDLAKQAIADFNRLNRIEDMVEVNARGKFAAVWRGERTPSVVLDRDGEHATDYGQHGSYPKKLDAYEVHCLINNIDKKADLAERCAQLRCAEMKVGEPAAELFPVEQQEQPRCVPAMCVICGHPKMVERDDGVYTCGTNHSR